MHQIFSVFFLKHVVRHRLTLCLHLLLGTANNSDSIYELSKTIIIRFSLGLCHANTLIALRGQTLGSRTRDFKLVELIGVCSASDRGLYLLNQANQLHYRSLSYSDSIIQVQNMIFLFVTE